MTNRKLDGK
jgi:hypothetical protein